MLVLHRQHLVVGNLSCQAVVVAEAPHHLPDDQQYLLNVRWVQHVLLALGCVPFGDPLRGILPSLSAIFCSPVGAAHRPVPLLVRVFVMVRRRQGYDASEVVLGVLPDSTTLVPTPAR